MPPFTVDPERQTICDVIRRWAEIKPGAPALLEDGKPPLTYAGLVKAMDALGAVLTAAGFGPGDRIAVIHTGGLDMAALTLGVIGGATAVPINPKHTEDEFAAHLRRRGAAAAIIEAGALDTARQTCRRLGLPVFEATGHVIAAPEGGPRHPLETRPARDTRPGAGAGLALVSATSGTTSQAKIVPWSHPRVIARAMVEERSCGLTEADVSIVMRPLHYSGPFNNVLHAVFTGGSIVILPVFEAEDFWRAIKTHKVTCYSGGPTFQKAVYAHGVEHPDEVAGTCIRHIRVGTARLDREVADGLEKMFGATVSTSYGSTETGRIAVNCPDIAARRDGTVGIAIDRAGFADAEVAIRGLDGRLQPAGGLGEVVVRGPQVFDGYENAPQLNDEAFMDGWFRTGDEGFIDDDGYLTLTGRIKEMINRGGEKVSPAEVDAALAAHPQVREAATFPIPHPTLGEEVAAAVVTEPGQDLTEQDLTKFLLTSLTGFKVPRRFVFVDAIPKSEYGKIQRYQLATTLNVDTTAISGTAGDPDRKPTPLEARLRPLWAKALGRDQVGLDENFFLAGGDSLKAVDLFLSIERLMKRRLPVAALFEAGTVADMARLIEEDAPQGCIVAIQPQGTRPPFFCVHGNGGEVIGFYNLARHLGDNQPFYGIQSIGWDGTTIPFTRTSDMAAHYVGALRQAQPRGPYFLGGYSFGGRVAVYMADLLEKSGEEVALLALLDPGNRAGGILPNWRQWMARHRREPDSGTLREALRFLWFRARKAWDGFYNRARRAIFFSIWDFYRERQWRLPKVLRRPDRANRLVRLDHDRIPRYVGDAVYFQASRSPRSAEHPDMRQSWDTVIRGELTVIPVPGLHHQIIQEPYAEVLARELDAQIVARLPKKANDSAA